MPQQLSSDNYITTKLRSDPGIQRDSTVYDSDSYVDGEWVRFYRGRPRKMGGEKMLSLGNLEIVRNMYGIPADNEIIVYLGQPSSLGYITVQFSGATSTRIDRTPLTGFTPSTDNIWSFDLFTSIADAEIGKSFVVAQVAQNVLDITSSVQGPIFFGSLDSNFPFESVRDTDLAGSPDIVCSGGVVFAPPIMIALDRAGRLIFSNKGKLSGPGSWSTDGTLNAAIIGNSNLVRAFRTRGSGAPTILIWSTTSLYSATYIEANPPLIPVATFGSQLLEDNITILSANCIIKYNQQFFWIGTTQFYMFNGIVQELPNTMCKDFFFDNINADYRAKTFGFANPRYSELIWVFVKKTPGLPDDEQPTEPNHAIIYNMTDSKWYDTPWSRASAVPPSTPFPFPIMAASNAYAGTPQPQYLIWQQEVGTDRVIGPIKTAIKSYYQTAYLDLFTQAPANDILMRVRRVSPDFVLEGPMNISVLTRAFPQDEDVETGPFTVTDATRKVDMSIQGRLVSLRFESVALGGYYQCGAPLLSYQDGDRVP